MTPAEDVMVETAVKMLIEGFNVQGKFTDRYTTPLCCKICGTAVCDCEPV